MTSPRGQEEDVALAHRILELERRVRELQAMPFRIPVLAADPPLTDNVNAWMFADGRLRMRFRNSGGTWIIKEWAAVVTPGATSSAVALLAPEAAPVSRLSSFAATWSMGYDSGGAQRTDIPGQLPYGDLSNAYGQSRSLVGFDYAAIATALTGSTVHSVSLVITNLDTWFDEARPFLGIHNYTAAPATWTGGGIPLPLFTQVTLPESGAVTLALPLEYATMIRAGTGKGIAIETPTDSGEFAGVAAGFGGGHPVPTLVVEYSK